MTLVAESQPGPIARALLAMGVALLGAMSAVFAALVSRHAWRPGEMTLPWGMLLALAGSVAMVFASRAQGRSFGFLAAAGWVVGLVGVLAGPGGDVVVAGDLLGYAFLLGATAVVLLTAAWRHPGA